MLCTYNIRVFIILSFILVSINSTGQLEINDSIDDFTIQDLNRLKEYFNNVLRNPKHTWSQIDSIKQKRLLYGKQYIDSLKSLRIPESDLKNQLKNDFNICEQYVGLNHFDSANIYAVKVLDNIGSVVLDKFEKVFYYYIISYVLIENGAHDKGITFLEKGKVLYNNSPIDEMIFHIDNLLIIANLKAGNISNAFNYRLIINTYLEDFADSIQEENRAFLFNNIGDIYLKIEEYDSARSYIVRSIQIRLKEEELDYASIASSFTNLGEVYLKNGDYPRARLASEIGLKIKKRVQTKNPLIDISSSALYKGLCLFRVSNLDSAQIYFKRVITLRYSQNEYKKLPKVLNYYSEYLAALNRLDDAIDTLKRSLQYSHPQSTEYAYANNKIADLYIRNGQKQFATDYLINSLEFAENLNSNKSRILKRMLEGLMGANEQIVKKKSIIEDKNKELALQINIIYLVGGILLLLSLLIIILLWHNRKAKAIIQTTSEDLTNKNQFITGTNKELKEELDYITSVKEKISGDNFNVIDKIKFEAQLSAKEELINKLLNKYSNINVMKGGKIITIGDNNTGSIIVDSHLENSLNKIKSTTGSADAELLNKVSDDIKESGNAAAVKLFELFCEEFNKPQPDKKTMNTYWETISKALPTISSIADFGVKIASFLI